MFTRSKVYETRVYTRSKTKRIKVVHVASFRERKERSDFKIKRFFFFFLEKET